jgi:hypothetical protein
VTVHEDRQVPVGPLLAGLGALVVAISLFLDWWTGLTAFDAYELLDLVALAFLMIVSLAGGLGLIRTTVSPGLTLAIAIVTVVIVVSQIINDPPIVLGGRLGHETGIWIALGGGLLMLAGAVIAYARISLAIDVRPHDGQRPAEPDEPAPPVHRDEAPDAEPTQRIPGRPAPVDPDAPTERP